MAQPTALMTVTLRWYGRGIVVDVAIDHLCFTGEGASNHCLLVRGRERERERVREIERKREREEGLFWVDGESFSDRWMSEGERNRWWRFRRAKKRGHRGRMFVSQTHMEMYFAYSQWVSNTITDLQHAGEYLDGGRWGGGHTLTPRFM